MIVTILCRHDIDRTLARKVSQWFWTMGYREIEFYVWGEDAHR